MSRARSRASSRPNGLNVFLVAPAPSPPSGPEGLLVCVTFTDLSGRAVLLASRERLRTAKIPPCPSPPPGGFHKGVVQVAVASPPIKNRLHLPPRLDVLFPVLEEFRVRKFGHLTSSVAGMINRPLDRSGVPSTL